MKVTVYTTTTCPYCAQLKDYLGTNKIEFTEKLVDQDDQAREEMMKKSDGFLGVPFTVISGRGAEEKIIGFDKGKLSAILGISA